MTTIKLARRDEGEVDDLADKLSDWHYAGMTAEELVRSLDNMSRKMSPKVIVAAIRLAAERFRVAQVLEKAMRNDAAEKGGGS
jgi:hypothetical protein